jgi:hypothetical protein
MEFIHIIAEKSSQVVFPILYSVVFVSFLAEAGLVGRGDVTDQSSLVADLVVLEGRLTPSELGSLSFPPRLASWVVRRRLRLAGPLNSSIPFPTRFLQTRVGEGFLQTPRCNLSSLITCHLSFLYRCGQHLTHSVI